MAHRALGAHREGVPLRILVVDDNGHFRRTVVELLTLRGFHVAAEAASGPEALRAVRSDCPDGVLLDVNMPGQDGYTVSALLAATCPASRIVLTSSETEDVPRGVLEECGAVAFVSKSELPAIDLRGLFQQPADGTPEP
jgi:CheY-like chemotaxis protein